MIVIKQEIERKPYFHYITIMIFRKRLRNWKFIVQFVSLIRISMPSSIIPERQVGEGSGWFHFKIHSLKRLSPIDFNFLKLHFRVKIELEKKNAPFSK